MKWRVPNPEVDKKDLKRGGANTLSST